MIKFSVIIPTYNSEKTLPVVLHSIAGQTFKNSEVLIMDGESTDNTLKIAEDFKRKIKQLNIYSEKDKGIYDAMNKGMKLAKGEWLIFMGSDDFFYTNKTLNNVQKNLEYTQEKVIYGNAKIIGNTGWAKDGDVYDGIFNIQKLLNKNICHQAIFYNTTFVNKEIGNFNIDYKKSADWDFNLRCWAKQPFKYIDVIVANFVAGGFSTNSNDKRIVEDFLDNVLQYFNISLFHPLVNNPNFIFYPKVIKKQKEAHALRYKFESLKNKIFKKLKRK